MCTDFVNTSFNDMRIQYVCVSNVHYTLVHEFLFDYGNSTHRSLTAVA